MSPHTFRSFNHNVESTGVIFKKHLESATTNHFFIKEGWRSFRLLFFFKNPSGTWWKRKVNHNLDYLHTKSNFSSVLDLFSDVRLKFKHCL